MLNRVFGFVLTATVLFAPAALAGDTAASPPPPNPHDTICKLVSDSQTTHLKRHVCMTRVEWQQKQANDRSELSDVQKRALSLHERM